MSWILCLFSCLFASLAIADGSSPKSARLTVASSLMHAAEQSEMNSGASPNPWKRRGRESVSQPRGGPALHLQSHAVERTVGLARSPVPGPVARRAQLGERSGFHAMARIPASSYWESDMKQLSTSCRLGLCMALLALAACQEMDDFGTPQGQPCTLIGCGAAMSMTRHVDASLDELRSSTMTLCRNEVCYTLSFAGFSEPDERGNITHNRVYFPMHGEWREGTPLYDASVHSAPGGGFELHISFTAWSAAELKDGDVYAVSVVTSAGRNLIDVRRAVTYLESQPNGPKCGPPCRTSRLD
ncbi:hypothetical protein [Pyxidicoccus trucidator]|uniref:hypothetical protein n=1 Tax=Pyxidicoccus trucidator TaxID=2709662 RepID=UPI0013DAAF31|nr:hypothetical protein [Pyxidicoccus trucidator]